MPPNDVTVVDRFDFRGLGGRPAWCRLELIPLVDGRTAVIVTEVSDNPGTSVTNAAEHLASFVCDRFRIDPDRLVWIEHYGYGGRRERTYDLVTSSRQPIQKIQWSEAVLRYHPSGWQGYFEEPEWRAMTDDDWQALGVTPRQPQRHDVMQ